MINTILTVIITFFVSSVLTWCVSVVKNHQKKDKSQSEALKCLLRCNITSKYYKYIELGYMPQYERENIIYMADQYECMKGNSYVKKIVKELIDLPVKNKD